MSVLRRTFIALLACGTFSTADAADATSAGIRAFESSFSPALVLEGEPEVRWTLKDRMAHHKVPGLSVAVIRNGRIAWAKAYGLKTAGTADRVDSQTVFSVGSVSKVGAAATTLRLVDAGTLSLDQDVNTYLKRWKVPANEFTAVRPVTLRGILSHTAGLTVHGFADYQPDEAWPSVLQTLDGLPPAKNEAVRSDLVPGNRMRYSGGGTTIQEALIEDVTSLSFPDAASRWVFEPLGMKRSTYENPLPASFGNIAGAHDEEGKPTALPRGWQTMPQRAASGLWTTPSDYARLMIALMESYQGRRSSTFLTPTLAHQMMSEVGPSLFGLGPQLAGRGATRRFYHFGSNDSYKALMEGHLTTGNGFVIFTNGANGFDLIDEARRALTIAEGWAFGGPVHVKPFALTQHELNELAGIYETTAPTTLAALRLQLHSEVAYEVWRDGDELRWGPAGRKQARRLVPIDSNHFVAENGFQEVEFVRDYGGEIERLVLRNGDFQIEAQKR